MRPGTAMRLVAVRTSVELPPSSGLKNSQKRERMTDLSHSVASQLLTAHTAAGRERPRTSTERPETLNQ